jgi:DNA-directed RNA polymerase subunit H (RpoH/RPB5)
MLQYRNLNNTGNEMPKQKLIESLNNYEYVTCTGSRPQTDIRPAADAKIILIAPGSKYANKTPEFKKLIKMLMKEKNFNELMFVSEQPLTIHIKKYLIEFKASNPTIYVEDYSYDLFLIELPKHASACPHEIVSKETIDKWCYDHYTLPERLSLILSGDPQAVWIGLRPGMVCRIVRLSETAGSAITYRYCIAGGVSA